MDDPDKDKWLTTMEQEMESMYSNYVWELIDLPESVSPLAANGSIRKREVWMGKWRLSKHD